MNRRRLAFLLAVAFVLGVVALACLLPWTRTTQAAPAPSGEATFKGKFLLVNTCNMSTFLLEKAQLQKMGDQTFLMGKGAAAGRIMAWTEGRTVWLRIEHVVAITEFDDVKEAQKVLEAGGGGPFGPSVKTYLLPATELPGGTPFPPAPPAPAPPATR